MNNSKIGDGEKVIGEPFTSFEGTWFVGVNFHDYRFLPDNRCN
ncbi:hypothetical protein [Coleofasciculus sp.]